MTVPPIYSAEDPGAPPHLRAVAWMAQDGPGKHWTCTGATQDEARAKLAAFWERVEAERPKKAPPRKGSASTSDITEDEDEIIV